MARPRLLVRASALGAVLIAVLAIACNDDPPSRPPVSGDLGPNPGGSAGGSGGSTDAGLDGTVVDGSSSDAEAGAEGGTAACNTLTLPTAGVDEVIVADAPPPGSGGTVLDGLYELSTAQTYDQNAVLPGPSGTTFRGALRVQGTAFERVLATGSNAAGGTPATTRSSGTFSVSGNTARLLVTCPAQAEEQLAYDASNTSLVLTNVASKSSLTFTRKP